MTLQASFIWKNPDATKDLNRRIEKIVNRGVIFGGNVAPATGLNVTVDASVAISFDGMTVVEDTPQTVLVAANTKNYIVLWAKYNDGGSPATPTLLWKVYDEATYLAHPEKDFLIVYCVVDVPAAVISILLDYIHFEYRDEVNPLARDWYRGTVATPAALPVPPPHGNRMGDFFFVQSDRTFHFWTGTAWSPLNTGSYNAETTLMNHMLVESQHERNVEGSGVVAGPRPGATGDFASDPEILIIETPSVADQVGLDTFSADVNGHRVELHGQYVTMDPKPGIGERYDLIFLEVWREFIDPASAVPEDIRYDRNPDGALKYTISEVDEKLQKLEWQQGIPTSPAADNFNLNPIDADDHGWNVLRYRLGTVSNLTAATLALYNPGAATVASDALNIDANAFTGQPAGSTADDRLWVAPAATSSVDGVSWAIPLFVVKRTSLEVTPNAIQTFRDGVRYVFPVYPVADASNAARKALDTVHRQEDTPFGVDHFPYEEPSGFLSGMDHVIETVAAPGTLDVYANQVKLRMRGLEDWLQTPCGPTLTLPAAPTVVGAWARNLIYLKMNITLYDNVQGTSVPHYQVSKKHRPYVPSNVGGSVRGQGWKRGYVQWQLVVEDLGSNNYLDEFDAMTASGWMRGDVTMAAAGAQYEDGGLWSKSIAIDADDRIHPFEAEWAIPICLIHRRNQSAWAFDTNPNGTGPTRPDDRQDYATISPDDLVDLRHVVNLTAADCEALMKESLDKMMKGALRTRMANKYLGAGTAGSVAGSRVLQTDYIGAAVGAYQLAAPDNYRTIWSDAKEFALIAIEIDITAASSSSVIHDWALAAGVGTLAIKSPIGATIVRHIPGAVHAVGNTTSADVLDFLGPPCWGTQWDDLVSSFNNTVFAHACALTYDSASNATGVLRFWEYNSPGVNTTDAYAQPFKVDAGSLDASGRATKMTGYVDTASTIGDTALLSFWVHYDRDFTGVNANNYGLAEIPDTVHKVTLNPSGVAEDVHVGPIYAVVDVTVTASTTAVITAADVAAATGTPGTVILWGMDINSVVSEPDMQSFLNPLRPYTLSAGAQDTITIQFTAPYTGKLSVKVYYHSDIKKWVEVGRGGKSVQGIFHWNRKAGINLGATPPTATDYTFGLGTNTWVTPTIGRNIPDVFPLVYTRSSTLNDWELVNSTSLYIRHAYSNAISLKPAIALLDQYVYVVWPNLQPLTPSDKLQIDYTYTPYQGLSAAGGDVATPAVAVPKLKKMLHGRIEGSTDFYVTQSGAASLYSGINTFTGKPVNTTARYANIGGVVSGTERLSAYNKTALVAPTSPYGAADLLTVSDKEKYALNAAAVLRLPFPVNPAMVSPLFPPYRAGVMDFDLDPERAGAGAGFFQYAPGYPNSGYSTTTLVDKYRGDHFINGLARLATNGDMAKQSTNVVVTADKFYPVGFGVAATLTVASWNSVGIGDEVSIQGSAGVSGLFENIPRVLTPYTSDVSMGSTGTSGSFLYDSSSNTALGEGATDPSRYVLATNTMAGTNQIEWTSIAGFAAGVAEKYILCTTPAVVTEYWRASYGIQLLVVAVLKANPGAAVSASVYASQFSIDADDAEVSWGQSSAPTKVSVDMIVVPMESGQRNDYRGSSNNYTQEEANSITTLRGRVTEYPEDWSPTTITQLETLLVGSDNGKGSGRGVYLGTSTQRFNMPMFTPGTGTSLEAISTSEHLVLDTPIAPPTYPINPTRPVFDRTNVAYSASDIGGPIAYVCYGTLVRPNDADYKNSAVLQISGGPTGGTVLGGSQERVYTSQALDGQAIDAFWMPGRPILKPQ